MPSNQDYQRRAHQELDCDLAPEEVNPEDQCGTHEQSSQIVGQWKEQRNPLSVSTVEVCTVQKGTVSLGEPLLVPSTHVTCEEDQKCDGQDSDNHNCDDGKDTTQGNETNAAFPLETLQVQHCAKTNLHVRLNEESHRSSPKEEVSQLVGDILNLWEKLGQRPHNEEKDCVEAHICYHDVEHGAEVVDQE